jgi:hypothetical protein
MIKYEIFTIINQRNTNQNHNEIPSHIHFKMIITTTTNNKKHNIGIDKDGDR